MKGAPAQFRGSNPTTAVIAIEVAISSLAVDRAKGADYAAAGIPGFWIVRPKAKKTEVYRNPVEGRFTEKVEIPAETTVESTALPGFAFNLADALATG